MRFFWRIARAYPTRSGLMLGFLLLAVLFEGMGISMLLTLLTVLLGPGGAGEQPSGLALTVRSAFDGVGLEPSLRNLLVLFLVATLLQSGLTLLARQQVGYTVARVATDLRLLLLHSLTAARWGYFTERPVGSLANSISTEATRAAMAYLSYATVLSMGIQALVYAGIAVAVSWKVTMAACVAAVLSMVAVRQFVHLSRKVGRKRADVNRSLMQNLTDGLQAAKPLKAMARESRLGPLVARDALKMNKVLRKRVVVQEAPKAIQAPLNALFAVVGIYLAVTYLAVPLAEVGVLALLFTYTVARLTKAQRQYQEAVEKEQTALALERQIERAAAHREVAGGSGKPSLEKGIALRGVRLSYAEQPVLAGVDLEIPAGQITALLGASGAGKTSLADLVCGLVPPDAGVVEVDGVPLRDLDLQLWRRMIGYVPQEIFLINDTVRANVTLGEELPDADVELALRRAGAWDFVTSLPAGKETVVGERGSRLSGGQRQRICIARALVHGPKLLILDEATTALDPEVEARIWEAICNLRGEVTVLAVSHQTQLMSVADRIYRVEEGTVRPEPAREGRAVAAPG